MIVDGAEQ
jgi:hypothetical protein